MLKTWKLHTRPYSWMPLVMILIQEIKYWWYALKRAQDQPYHFRILFRLGWALPQLWDASTLIGEIKQYLLNQKAKLWQELGNPNWWQTWLEELAEVQAQATKTTPKKRLKHLLWTEEQQKHMRHIKCTNHSMQESGGLVKVTTTNDGQVTHHYSKAGIAWRGMPRGSKGLVYPGKQYPLDFLQEPLLSDLQLLGTHLPMFNQIAAGTYRPPQGTSNQANQLLPLLTCPLLVTDRPMTITAKQHQQGWTKAKETTSVKQCGISHFTSYSIEWASLSIQSTFARKTLFYYLWQSWLHSKKVI